MNAFGGVLAAAALVLLGSGAAKLTRPEPTQQALFALRLPSQRAAVVAIGSLELLVGAAALVVPGAAPALAVAALYAGFVAFVAMSMRSGSAAGCGCFGAASSTPPGVMHLIVNTGFAAAALLASGGTESLVDTVVDDPGTGLAVLVVAIVVAALATAVLTVLPDTRAAAPRMRKVSTPSPGAS